MAGDHRIEYEALIANIPTAECNDHFGELVEALEGEWLHFYKEMTPRITNISGQIINGFEYVYDDYASLEKAGKVPFSETIESRVVYVHGRSQPTTAKRNFSRQKGWVGPTEMYLGASTDKGHFMAHSIGGGLEIKCLRSRPRDKPRMVAKRQHISKNGKLLLHQPGHVLFQPTDLR